MNLRSGYFGAKNVDFRGSTEDCHPCLKQGPRSSLLHARSVGDTDWHFGDNPCLSLESGARTDQSQYMGDLWVHALKAVPVGISRRLKKKPAVNNV